MKLIEVGDKAAGALPMSKLDDEATALLTACNSILNSAALQGMNVPPRLLSDLTLFCRQNTGHMIPFQALASMQVDVGNPANSEGRRLCHVAMGISNGASLVRNQCELLRDGLQEDSGVLLEELGMLELKLERLYQFFGWSKQLVRIAARNKLDKG